MFWLELPLIACPIETLLPEQPHSTNRAALPQAATSDLRILVADDVPMNRDIASSFLRSVGYEVICAKDGEEAVEFASSGDFDVVLMDVRMPKMDGLVATRRIRALPGRRGRVQIVALTAQAFVDQVRECRRAGMDDHLTKPFTLDTLLATVSSAAARGDDARTHMVDLADLDENRPAIATCSAAEISSPAD